MNPFAAIFWMFALMAATGAVIWLIETFGPELVDRWERIWIRRRIRRAKAGA